MEFGEGQARLGKNVRLALVVRHGYRFSPPDDGVGWRIETTSYAYRLIDRDGRFVLSYHWHPTGNSPVVHPHLHVGYRTPVVDFARAHLPTGHVFLPTVLRAAIAELGVDPLRADWSAILERAERDLSPPG